ncbi:hypothetical protein PVAP13_2KG410405 [Panicum virgatum]|uniref:Uncharacterized protein n=1 Tax=Panicum virgatum TaxID=38727 RepID=A0A8T0W9Q1_PANVG|nr:hypothetical protein PVAP13_2KG410405 [Panicum virgatum]
MEGTGGGDRAGIDSGDFCSSRHQIKGTMRCAGHRIDAHPVLLVGGRSTGDSAFQRESNQCKRLLISGLLQQLLQIDTNITVPSSCNFTSICVRFNQFRSNPVVL